MTNFNLVLITTLLAAGTSQADEGLQVRYQDPTGRMSMTVSHDITVQNQSHPIASRSFSFDLALATDRAAAAVTVTIDQATGSYTAHGTKERLGTRHLAGRSFPLSIGDDGRKLEAADLSDAPVIDLGSMIGEGLSIPGVLAGVLPVLPGKAVAVGSTWTTERPVRSLQGWAWTTGRLTSRHRITAVDRRDAHTVVTVVTEAEASLGSVEGGPAYSGDLKRTLRWTFDATDGHLLSMSMEQETEGMTVLPQGEMSLHQLTRVELEPRS